MDTNPDHTAPQETSSGSARWPTPPLLETKGLQVGHRPGKAVLEDVSLRVQAGEWLALIGGNGSGKSTLLQSLSGLLPVLQGQVLLEGKALTQWNPRARARHMAILLTGMPMATGMTVDQFLALGRFPYRDWMGQDPEGEARAVRVRSWLGLEAFGRRPFSSLSDGERQRVLLGRVLVQDAPLMLLDEPTHHLDPAQRVRMQAMLARWRTQETDRGVVVSTHDLDWAFASADRIGVLDAGRLHWGTPDQWREAPERLLQAYRGQGLHLNTDTWRFEAP